jgi:riboflavin biosynthesis pyrimidine reductase
MLTAAPDIGSMRALIAGEARPAGPGRPWVLANMVTALDGSVSVAGKSAPLSSPGDHAHFHALRELADAILVGSGTALGEGYGAPVLEPQIQAQRVARGQKPNPRLVIVSRSNRVRGIDADVVGVDDGDVAGLIAQVARRHGPAILCEGGPALLTTLAPAHVVSEWCVTVSPLLGGSEHKGIVNAPLNVQHLELDRVAECDGYLLLRYLDPTVAGHA